MARAAGANLTQGSPPARPARDEALPPAATTGSVPLDTALGGGLPLGTTWLVEGEHGAGADVFALSVLQRRLDGSAPRGRPRLLTTLRSAARVQREWAALFGSPPPEIVDLRGGGSPWRILQELDVQAGDVLVLETAAAIHRAGHDLVALVDDMAETVANANALLLVVHATGSLPSETTQQLGECVDGILGFRWSAGPTTSRRLLQVVKMRGLAPLLEHEQVPVFELTLERGIGFGVSRVKSVA